MTRVADYMSLEEIRLKMQMTAGFFKMQKFLVIYNAIVDPRPDWEIARHVGLSEATVHRIIAEYNEVGREVFEASSGVTGQMKSRLRNRKAV